MAVAIRITPPRVIKWTAMAILVLVYSLRLRNVPELITLGRSSRKGPKTRKKKTQLMTLGRGTRILRLSPGTDNFGVAYQTPITKHAQHGKLQHTAISEMSSWTVVEFGKASMMTKKMDRDRTSNPAIERAQNDSIGLGRMPPSGWRKSMMGPGGVR